MKTKILNYSLSLLTAGAASLSVTTSVQAADKKPNILVIWGDDIGMDNILISHWYRLHFRRKRMSEPTRGLL